MAGLSSKSDNQRLGRYVTVRWGAYGWRVCYDRTGSAISAYELFNDTPQDLDSAIETWLFHGGYGGLAIREYLTKIGFVE